MDKNTFIVSDESKNTYGYIVLTSGIDTTQFLKNPIMYYMHNREKGVIGRWENLRKEGNRLLADAVLDDSTEQAQIVKKQIEKGFLRCASIGLDNVETAIINGVETVVKCRLVEISIVDQPANENAIKLYKKSGKVCFTLADYAKDDAPGDLKTALIALLGLEKGVSDSEILRAVENAINAPSEEDINTTVENAVSLGYIDKTQKGVMVSLARSNIKAFKQFITLQKQKETAEINTLIDDAVNSGKVLNIERETYTEIAYKLGSTYFKRLLFTLRTAYKPTDLINRSGRDTWSLNDYRKFAPEELVNDHELYNRLLSRETTTPLKRSLEWYRKNAPEELINNPELYKQLLNK